jgi:AraC-like DNA-binding protein
MICQKTTTASLVIRSAIYNSLSAVALRFSHLLNPRSFSEVINSVINYISENLSADLKISKIVVAVNMAQSTLSAKFKKEVGVSVGEYIDYRLILSAMELLTTTEKTICEISDILGYSDQFYFSRRFKKRYGVSPQKFRNIK